MWATRFTITARRVNCYGGRIHAVGRFRDISLFPEGPPGQQPCGDRPERIGKGSEPLPSLRRTVRGGNTSVQPYGYDASGSKLSVTYTSGANTVKTEYAGNKVYRNGTLSMLLTEEGYVTLSENTPTYHYYLRDH